MQTTAPHKLFSFFLATTLVALMAPASGQSLADYAKQQKQQKDAQPVASASPKMYTNDDISAGGGSHAEPAATPTHGKTTDDAANKAKEDKFKQKATQVSQQIRQQKRVVRDLELQIDQLRSEMQPAGTVTANTVQYNQRQRNVQNQIERLQQKLGGERQKLEAMQESARKEGYGTAVYDPS